jgi:hypothetical protein
MPLRGAVRSSKLARTARKGMRMRMRLLVVLAMVFSLALAGTALAQDNATEDAYGGVVGEEVGNSDDGGVLGEQVSNSDDSSATTPVQVTQSSDGDSLPFTGLELGLVVLAGIGLVTLGFVMRRSTRHTA